MSSICSSSSIIILALPFLGPSGVSADDPVATAPPLRVATGFRARFIPAGGGGRDEDEDACPSSSGDCSFGFLDRVALDGDGGGRWEDRVMVLAVWEGPETARLRWDEVDSGGSIVRKVNVGGQRGNGPPPEIDASIDTKENRINCFHIKNWTGSTSSIFTGVD